jgi:hypothetical protein
VVDQIGPKRSEGAREWRVADPLLVVTGETYTLAADSPAYSLGFTSIDPSGNGPVGVGCFDDADCLGGEPLPTPMPMRAGMTQRGRALPFDR